MFTENFCVISGLIFLCIALTVTDTIKTKYMQDDEDCMSPGKRLICEKKCGINHACIYGKCICLKQKSSADEIHLQDDPKDTRFSDFDDYTEMTPILYSNNRGNEHPALRHHIAHFCPNLEVARECIRHCMKLGKPAFCGKDHVCYCGHKYDKPQGGDQLNARDIYAQFRDMYEKYFGPNEDSKETVVELLEKDKRVLMERDNEEEK